GEGELGPVPELLDDREHVVPAAGVEPRRVVAQLVQDLVHLEGGGDGLDQHRGLDGAPRYTEPVGGQLEGVVPQSRLEVALQLGQVQVDALAVLQQPPAAGDPEQPEVDQAARGRVGGEHGGGAGG